MEPIACKLDPSDFSVREAEIRALHDEFVLDVRRSARHIVWRFGDAPGVRERFVAMAAAESECCSFLEFAVSEDALTISAREGAEGALADLFG